MLRLILIVLLFLLSLLTVFKAPTSLLWYVSILITECSWIFFCIVSVLLCWRFGENRYPVLTIIIGCASLLFFSIPIITAFRISSDVENIFSNKTNSSPTKPFYFWKMITGLNAKQVAYKTLIYDKANELPFDFYSSLIPGKKPCIIVVHGGSWAGGDSRQLPELNSELAKNGYNVATINYRLAPQYKFPAPIVDLENVLHYLRSHADDLSIDTGNIILLGRSAGAQIVLSAAYTLSDPSIKGVISFYGPADMVWGYAHPTNPLVLNSRKVMEDYLGGTFNQVPQQYVKSSATETITAHSVPTLLLHGENDPLVSHLHDVRLSKKLDSLNVEHYTIYFPWATHGFDWTLNGPAGQISTWSVFRFLKIVTTDHLPESE